MRESFTYGSVRGAGSNPSPYRDRRAASVGATEFHSPVFFRQRSLVNRIVGECAKGVC